MNEITTDISSKQKLFLVFDFGDGYENYFT